MSCHAGPIGRILHRPHSIAMSVMARAAGLVCLASIGLMLLVTFWGGTELPPIQITSDTPAYCSQLLQRVGQLTHVASGTPPQAAANLAGEGGKLCRQGKVRAGILRLRRAVKLMMATVVHPH